MLLTSMSFIVGINDMQFKIWHYIATKQKSQYKSCKNIPNTCKLKLHKALNCLDINATTNISHRKLLSIESDCTFLLSPPQRPLCIVGRLLCCGEAGEKEKESASLCGGERHFYICPCNVTEPEGNIEI